MPAVSLTATSFMRLPMSAWTITVSRPSPGVGLGQFAVIVDNGSASAEANQAKASTC